MQPARRESAGTADGPADPFGDLQLPDGPQDGVEVPVVGARETPEQRRRRLGAKIALDRVREARAAEEGGIRTALRSFSEGATRVASNVARYGGALAESAALGPGSSPLFVAANPKSLSQTAARGLTAAADAIAPTEDNAGRNVTATVAGGTAGEFAASQAAFGTLSGSVAQPVSREVQRLTQLAAAGKLSPRVQRALGPLLERLAPQMGPAVPSAGAEAGKAILRAAPGELLAGGATGGLSSPLEEITSAKNTGFSLLGAVTAGAPRARGVQQVEAGRPMPVSLEEALVRRLEEAAAQATPTGAGGAVRRRPAPPTIGEPVVAEGVGRVQRVTPQSEVQRQVGREALRAAEAKRLGVPRSAIGPARRRPGQPAPEPEVARVEELPPAPVPEAIAEPTPTLAEPFTMGALDDSRVPLVPEVAEAPTLAKIAGRKRVRGEDGPPVEGEVPTPTPAPAVRVRAEFRALRTPDLLAKLTEEQQRLDGETSDLSHGGWTRQQDDGTVISGNSFRSGKLRNQAKLTGRRIEELEQELRARGVSDDDLLNARMTGVEQAAERLPFEDEPAPERDPWDPDPEVPDQQEPDAPRVDGVEPPVVVEAFPEGTPRPQAPETIDHLVRRVGGEGMSDGVEAELRRQVEASGVVAQRVSFDDQRRAAQQLAGELGVDYTTLRPDVASRLSASEIGARVLRHRVNVHLMERVSQAMTRGDATPEQAAQYAAALERLEADSQKVLADVLRATSQKGRDLGALRAFGRQTLDPAFWEVQAARRLGGVGRLTDAMRADIRRLAREAAEACGLGG